MKLKINTAEFLSGIEDAISEIDDRIQKGVELACVEVEGAAARKVPKVSADGLRMSIAHRAQMVDQCAYVGEVGSPLFYAPFVHEGTGIYSRTGMGRKNVPWSYKDEKGNWHTTSGIQPNPFLEKAADEKRDRVRKVIYKALKG